MALLTGAACPMQAQSFLFFQKNRYRQATYHAGDPITVRVRNKGDKVSGRITGFLGDSLVLTQQDTLRISAIEAIYVDGKTREWFVFRYKYKHILPIAGVGYLLIDRLNSGFVNRSTLLVSGTLIGAGILARLLISEQIRIRGKRKLLIMH